METRSVNHLRQFQTYESAAQFEPNQAALGAWLVRRYYQEALNPGRFDRLDDLLTNEFVDHEELRGIPPTREGLKQKYTLLRAGFPDFGFTIEDLFSAADRVTVRGTHEGEFMGRPATGRQFAVPSVGIFRIVDGRIAEHWGVFEPAGHARPAGCLRRLTTRISPPDAGPGDDIGRDVGDHERGSGSVALIGRQLRHDQDFKPLAAQGLTLL